MPSMIVALFVVCQDGKILKEKKFTESVAAFSIGT